MRQQRLRGLFGSGGRLPEDELVRCPYDNAKAKSFFKTLKQEEVYLTKYQNFEDAQTRIGVFLDDVYNAKRLHSSLGYCPLHEFEAACRQTSVFPVEC